MPPKVSDILKQLNEDGWYIVATRGSHRQFKHPSKPGRVTVHGKPGDDIAPGTLNSILKQSGLKNEVSDALRSRDREVPEQLFSVCPGSSRVRRHRGYSRRSAAVHS